MIAFVYNLQPITIIPDFIPVIGFLDNIVVTGWALRSVVRSAGVDTLSRHWQGSSQEFELLLKVTHLR